MINNIKLGTIVKTTNKLNVVRAQVKPILETDVEEVALLNSWGSNSNPNIGDPCIIFVVDGASAKKYAIPFNLNDAINIAIGEKIIFNKEGNTKIHLKSDGSIDIEAVDSNTSPTINITATSGINITGDVTITGDLSVTGDSTLTGTSTTIAGKDFLTHVHSGVTSGGSNTGGVT